MRFAAPRSPSPSPTRNRRHRPRSTFAVPSESSSEDEDDASGSESASSSEGEWLNHRPEPPKPRREKSLAEQWAREDTLAAVRRRINYHDPYEEWEKETRQEAFRVARQKHTQDCIQQRNARNERRAQDEQRSAALHEQQLKEVESQLAAMNLQKQQEEAMLRAQWKERDRQLWARIDAVIKQEEERRRVEQEAERKKREEEERLRREAEEKKRQEEERKRKEEEEKRKQKEKEDEERRIKLAAAQAEKEREQAETEARKALGHSTAFEDWRRGRDTLRTLKAGPMKTVKQNKEMKAIWSAGRRAITPKVGQLTSDMAVVVRVSHELVNILRPPQAHPPPIYIALLSSLAKAILMQAETEVTAEKKSAMPLAQLTVNLLTSLEGFADIFWAKLCQRAGGWPVPIAIPANDTDGTTITPQSMRKVQGFRDTDEGSEVLGDYTSRVTGILRVYFTTLVLPVNQPLDPMFRMDRYWTYFTRMLKDPQLLESPVAAQIMFTALDIGGLHACAVWGSQWTRLLALLFEGVTVGYHGLEGRLIGGKAPEGNASRTRLQLEVERIMAAAST
ncbi:GLE1-like protein-domain-containing protein [Dichomitus squalens]|uniref:mRNA export factor GLE1 n=1 Tax=Dichomitus squalens TaxID=114155 RepID=A0A4Q9PMP6_9APHY|nr:GLE1-like protein-domain-containing protein [Dichomitus squalens]